MTSKNTPFNFVLDYLLPLEVTVRPFFGMRAIYVNEKIVLILRQRDKHPEINGVWVATNQEHHNSLKKDLPSLCSIATKSDGFVETEWQLLPIGSDDFETSVQKVCELIKHNDHRIGRIPKLRPVSTRAKGTKITKAVRKK